MFCRIIFNRLKGYSKDGSVIVTKNSHNNILHFKLNNNGTLEYFFDEFLIKKVPKEKKDQINEKEVYLINLSDSSILIQPITDVYMLTISEQGISQVDIRELTPGTQCIRYDSHLNDYYCSNVLAVNKVGNYNDIFTDIPEFEDEEINDFNNYIVGSEKNKGIIISDFMIIGE